MSIIVPVYNAAPTLPQLLSALRSQRPTRLGPSELLIVDNGSTDDSRRIALESGIAEMRVLDERRRGPSAARNRGLAEARGGVIALIDADCVPTRAWLRELVAAFERPEVLIVAGALASYPPRTPAQRFAARYGLNEALRPLQTEAMPFANTRNMAVRREAAAAVGGWPEDLTHGEDVEFSFRIRERFACSIEYAEAALVFHQDRASDDDLGRQAYGYGHGMAILYRRHPERLPWTTGSRLHRLRRSTQRRLSARLAPVAQRAGRVAAGDVEFARYLAFWDRSFWRGFDDGWRETSPRQG